LSDVRSAEQIRWSECGQATSFPHADALGRPHRLVLPLDKPETGIQDRNIKTLIRQDDRMTG
jgi:hypothetical protein